MAHVLLDQSRFRGMTPMSHPLHINPCFIRADPMIPGISGARREGEECSPGTLSKCSSEFRDPADLEHFICFSGLAHGAHALSFGESAQ